MQNTVSGMKSKFYLAALPVFEDPKEIAHVGPEILPKEIPMARFLESNYNLASISFFEGA